MLVNRCKFQRAALGLLGAMIMLSSINPRAAQPEGPYEANWESLDARPVPAWFPAARFGLFIHWGVYSVPAWAPKGEYAEWYLNSMRSPGSATQEYHNRTWGEDFKYEDFAPLFTARAFDADQWARMIAGSGARYVVLTSKHHDGYCLWPSAQRPGWNSVDIGAGRDLVGELAGAVRKEGVKFGLYYSIYEWTHPLYPDKVDEYVEQYMMPQFKDLVTRYAPAVIFADGEWDHPSSVWRTPELLAWLYNQAPGREDVVVNDRWGSDCRSRHGGYFTTEYGQVGEGRELASGRAWEENRGMGRSFGYNRNEDLEDYQTAGALIELLVSLASRGGNLNLDIAPTAEGRIPVIMQERLAQMGRWLRVNGEAIYETQPWWIHGEQEFVYYTRHGGTVYATLTRWPGAQMTFENLRATSDTRVTLLGTGLEIPWSEQEGCLRLDLSAVTPERLPCEHAWVFAVQGADLRHLTFTPREACFSVSGQVKLTAWADWDGQPMPEGTAVRYTLDGQAPGAHSEAVDGPLTLTRHALVRAACFDARGRRVSPEYQAQYYVSPFTTSARLKDEPPRPQVALEDLTPLKATTGWRQVTWGACADGSELNVGGVKFHEGVGVHAPSELVYAIDPAWTQFVAQVGVHGEAQQGSVVVEVLLDKIVVHRSPLLRGGEQPWAVAVPIEDGPHGRPRSITLRVTDGGDGGAYDLTDWGWPGFCEKE